MESNPLHIDPEQKEIEEKATLTLPKKIFSTGISVLFFLGLIYYIVTNFAEIKEPLETVSWQGVALLILLAAIPAVLRAECWYQSCDAAGSKVPKAIMYSSATTSYVAQSFVSYLGVAVRISMLRKIAPELAPRITTLLAAEAPVIVLEGVIFLPIFIGTAIWIGLPLWVIGAAVLIIAALLIVVKYVNMKLTHHPWVDGLKSLKRSHHMNRIILLIFVIIALSALRTYVALQVLGVDASIVQATVAMGVMTFFAVMNFGVAAGPSAMVLIFGSTGPETAAAVGLLTASVGIIGAAIVAILSSAKAIYNHRKYGKIVLPPTAEQP